MRDFGLTPAVAVPMATLLPVSELLCAAALIPAASAQWGAVGVLLLLTLFVVAIAISLARGRRPDCHCFGQLHSEPVGWKTLIRNLALAAIAGLVIWHGSAVPHVSALRGAAGLSESPFLLIVVAATAAAAAALSLLLSIQLLRQNGRLLVRLDSVERKLGIIPGAATSALPVDNTAPAFSLRDLDGQIATLDSLVAADKPLLLVFSEPGCGSCDELLPEVGRWQREYEDRLTTVVISRGTVGQNKNKQAKHDLGRVLLQVDREVADAYGVVGTPSACVVHNGKIARAIAAGPGDTRSLVVDLVAIRARKGEPAPAFALEDLHGNSISSSSLHGDRTLLLFWNPACGYCQQMLDDLKAWELRASVTSPQLLVISTGSAASNEEQGFRSRVLLDPDFTVANMFGAGGTPAAVLLDQQSMVVSEVAVGKQAVMALAS